MANAILREDYPIFALYQALRTSLLDAIGDEDLAFRLPGENLSLGDLCREIGRVEGAYIESFRTLRWSIPAAAGEADKARTVREMRGWFETLDEQLREAVAALTDEDLDTCTVDRGEGFRVPPRVQLQIYKEALLIFYGKASVYLKARQIEPSPQWQEWIA